MKFLVHTRHKDAILMLPPEQRIAIWEGTVASIEKYQKMGKCKEIYMDVDMQGGVSIWETDSEEEAVKFVLDSPISPFSNFEIRPVIAWDTAIKASQEHLHNLAK